MLEKEEKGGKGEKKRKGRENKDAAPSSSPNCGH